MKNDGLTYWLNLIEQAETIEQLQDIVERLNEEVMPIFNAIAYISYKDYTKNVELLKSVLGRLEMIDLLTSGKKVLNQNLKENEIYVLSLSVLQSGLVASKSFINFSTTGII